MSYNITVEGGTSVRLPTAGKYCDRDIIVTAEGGGLALDVVTASALPDAVVDGQIVVITETAPGTVYIDTDEPASPATGDLWIEVAAGGDAALELTEESPYLRNGLKNALQYNGSEWPRFDGYIGTDGQWVKFAAALPPVGTALNDMTWDDISAISAAGLASSYFKSGDRKAVPVSGSIAGTTLDGTYYCFIMGIDHNKELEGKGIHFQFGWNDLTGGANVAFVYQYKQSVQGFMMNTSHVNKDGWEGSYMRNTICAEFLACLPAELQGVIKACKKYSDNTGQANTAAIATATEDKIWIPSQYEIHANTTGAAATEKDYQNQYEYYSAGNSKVKYRSDSTSAGALYWTRTPGTSAGSKFRCTSESGTYTEGNAALSYGFAPCFMV